MNQINWKLEKRNIKSLKNHPKNPRKMSSHDAEHLKKSLEKFGLIDKPIINTDNMIIGGHQRLSVLKKMGVEEIECYVPDEPLSQEDIDELNLRLNRNTGEWDWDILANEWDPTELIDAGFLMDELLGKVEDIPSDEESEDVLEPTKDPITKKGDLYQLGNHFLLCGDSTLPEDVQKLLNYNRCDICFTSPPYGAADTAKLRNITKKPELTKYYQEYNDDPKNWIHLMRCFYENIKSNVDASIINIQMLAGNKISFLEFMYDYRKEFVDIIIWNKSSCQPAMGENILNSSFEFFLIFGGNSTRTIPHANFRGTISNVVSFEKEKNEFSDVHKAVFSLALPIWVMDTLCSECKTILDPFGGTGTTLIAAEKLNRSCYMMELDPAYCDLIVNRWIRSRKKSEKSFEVSRNGEICEDFNG